MTARKARLDLPAPPPQPKAVPYPPATIWKTKEEGVAFDYRGNVFERRGNHVARVLAGGEAAEKTAGGSQKPGQ